MADPFSWNPSVFHVDAGIGLSTCIEHRGEHPFISGSCRALRSEPRSSDKYPPCAKHDGRHQDVNGQCVHWGAPVALRPGVCRECSAPIFHRLTLATGRVDVVEEGSDLLHVHPAPARAEVNTDGLAAGIALALDELMRRRGEERASRLAQADSNSGADSPPPTIHTVEL